MSGPSDVTSRLNENRALREGVANVPVDKSGRNVAESNKAVKLPLWKAGREVGFPSLTPPLMAGASCRINSTFFNLNSDNRPTPRHLPTLN